MSKPRCDLGPGYFAEAPRSAPPAHNPPSLPRTGAPCRPTGGLTSNKVWWGNGGLGIRFAAQRRSDHRINSPRDRGCIKGAGEDGVGLLLHVDGVKLPGKGVRFSIFQPQTVGDGKTKMVKKSGHLA